jgi:hypothetical protein
MNTGLESVAEVVDETAPLLDVVPGYGPPVLLIVAPWLLIGLLLAGPMAVLFTLVVALLAVAACVALAGALLASPYLLVSRLRRRRERLAFHPAVRSSLAA